MPSYPRLIRTLAALAILIAWALMPTILFIQATNP